MHAPKAPKSTKKHKKHQKYKKHQKTPKNTKTQPSKNTKTQTSEQRSKMCLKASEWKTVTYLLICVFVFFCAREEKEIENKKNGKSLQCNVLNSNVPINHFRCVCVYLREPVCGDINLVKILTSLKLVKIQVKIS